MKALLIGLLTFISFHSAAAITGTFESSEGVIRPHILSYQAPNTINLSVSIEGEEEPRYRNHFAIIDIEDYIKLFYTNEDVQFVEKNLEYFGSSSNGVRSIVVVMNSFDDNDVLAQKEVVTIELENGEASLRIETFRRKRTFLFVGDLKKVYDKTVLNLEVSYGVEMYGDNLGWPNGKVADLVELRAASQSPRESVFDEVCSIDCDY